MFVLDPVLTRDTHPLGDFPVSRLLLCADANYPWFILVPRRAGITELCDLQEPDQQALLRESIFLCHRLRAWFSPDKLNVAALGNVVSQLHIHHIVRYRTDPAWPAPVWGAVTIKKYKKEALNELIMRLTGLEDYPGYASFD